MSRCVLRRVRQNREEDVLGSRLRSGGRTVYVREVADARRRTMRRSKMIAEFSDVLGDTDID